MIKFENIKVVGLDAAIRGMRNPTNSWDKSDSYFNGDESYCKNVCQYKDEDCDKPCYHDVLGPNDLALTKKLRNAGTDHRKFMRMMVVYVDITAPLYWWKEFDTYKIGTVANSCSTMHTITNKKFALNDFSCEHLTNQNIKLLETIIEMLNIHRQLYLNTNTEVNKNHIQLSDEACCKVKKDIWWQITQLLPSSYNQKRTIMLNYEVLLNIYESRKDHKLDEWTIGFCNWIRELPYSELITGEFIN